MDVQSSESCSTCRAKRKPSMPSCSGWCSGGLQNGQRCSTDLQASHFGAKVMQHWNSGAPSAHLPSQRTISIDRSVCLSIYGSIRICRPNDLQAFVNVFESVGNLLIGWFINLLFTYLLVDHHLYLSLYLSLCLSTYPILSNPTWSWSYLMLSDPICLSRINPWIVWFSYLSINISACLCIHRSTYIPIYPSINLSTCVTIYKSIHRSIHLLI